MRPWNDVELLEQKALETLCWDWVEEDDCFVHSWCADFETTTTADDCRVWAWGVSEIGEPDNVEVGNAIVTFIGWCRRHAGDKVYFHNLKFDGKFILSYLMQNGWEFIEDMQEARNGAFECLISDMNQWYQIRIWFSPRCCITIQDSLKVISLPVALIPKAFGIPISKLELDYKAYREPGHELTPEEREYLLHDVKIVAMAMEHMFSQGLTKMTAGSNAYADYKRMMGGEQRFRTTFPAPDYDDAIRSGGCYKGGFTAANPAFAGQEVGEGVSFDVNSLYPSVMAGAHGELLPYGEPVAYEGNYVSDPEYPVYIQFLAADFRVKPGHIPSLQLKTCSRFSPTEYVRDSEGMVQLCLTNVDLELMLEQYDILEVEYYQGLKFRASDTLFRDYVDKWTEVKTEATLAGNTGLRTIAKLQLNSLYGKLASNPVKQSRKPVMDDYGCIHYVLMEEELTEPQYLPTAAFVTAYARAFTIRASQANYSRWLYSDTDSCYLLGTEPPEGIKVDDVELGAWKQEHHFSRFKALRAKTYVFEEDGELCVTCAGMPANCHKGVTFENFEVGTRFSGKLRPVDVKGGTILVDDFFTIKE